MSRFKKHSDETNCRIGSKYLPLSCSYNLLRIGSVALLATMEINISTPNTHNTTEKVFDSCKYCVTSCMAIPCMRYISYDIPLKKVTKKVALKVVGNTYTKRIKRVQKNNQFKLFIPIIMEHAIHNRDKIANEKKT